MYIVSPLKNIAVTFETIYVIFKEFIFPNKIYVIFFIILPPSNGYIGSILNRNIKIFEYIINSIGISNILSIFDLLKINIKIIFVNGPAIATINFFITNRLDLSIFLL